VKEILAWADYRKPVASVHEEEEEESAHGEISDEDQIFSGPWVSKGNPIGFLDSDDKEVVDQMGHDWRERRLKAIKVWEWKFIAQILLKCTVSFVESELVETEDDMKEFDLMIRILGKDGSMENEGLMRIVKAFSILERQIVKFYQQQDDANDILEARDGIITGLKEQLA